jgi:hypothetical protein
LEFLFTDKDTEGLTELYSSVRNSSFGDFVVDPNALQVVFVGKCIQNIFIYSNAMKRTSERKKV